MTLAAVAFVAFIAAFVWELLSYQHKVEAWAQRDLQSRVDLAAANLEEPLRTQDFRRIHAFGESCMTEGYRLSIFSSNGSGRVFDTSADARFALRGFYADQRSGDYLVRLWIPSDRVLKPFFRALVGTALATFAGILGVVLFFLVTYRQRVRIRELAKLEKFRREFIADVSHEIKTPLTGIMGAVELLGELQVKAEGEGEQRNVLVSLMKKESRRLNGLVQSILDLARLEREGDVLNLEEIDLGELVREQAEKFKVEFRGGDVSSPRFLVRCDPQLIEQAVSNLIGNAVRHSGSEEILVTVERDGKGARIVVEDHGIGIPPEHAARIFERFHRVDPARSAETGGAGLGLAIVRRIARLHGGDVVFSPVNPQGSRFTLSLHP